MSELIVGSATILYERALDEHRIGGVDALRPRQERAGAQPAQYHAVGDDGTRRRLPLERWLRRAAAAEEQLLALAVEPVLDIGCGVGRHLAALRQLGIEATGVDVSTRAAEIARASGSRVIEGSIFDAPVGTGWKTVLLLDGNIGIGGDPKRLLSRVAELLSVGGEAFIELDPPRAQTRQLRLRLEGPDRVSDWIPWAWVGVDAIGQIATEAGLDLDGVWSTDRRWFARLSRQPAL